MLSTQTEESRIESEVRIPTGRVTLEGTLFRPAAATALVIFAHGIGSGRLSPRNVFVASELQRGGFATLLIDLLTAREELADKQSPGLHYDVEALAERMVHTIDWARRVPGLEELRVGVCGANIGGAAALAVAAARPYIVHAVVCRGTRTDLSASHLPFVKAPTLLIAGEHDAPVIAVNEEALAEMVCDAKLEVIRGASHMFDEPGALQHVAELSREWFDRHLVHRWQD
jgi:dienelactone hydrolase